MPEKKSGAARPKGSPYWRYRKAVFLQWRSDFGAWVQKQIPGRIVLAVAGVLGGVWLEILKPGSVNWSQAAATGALSGGLVLIAYIALGALWYAVRAPYVLWAASDSTLAALSRKPGIALEEREQVRVIAPTEPLVGTRAYVVYPDVCITNNASGGSVTLELELWLSHKERQYVTFAAESGPVDGWEARKRDKGVPGRQPLPEPLNLPPSTSAAGYVSFHVYPVRPFADDDAGWTDAEEVTAHLVVRDRLSGVEIRGREYSLSVRDFRKNL